MDIKKIKHAAGGYRLQITAGKGNTRFSQERKNNIINYLGDANNVEGVYIRDDNEVVAQFFNGSQRIL